MEQQPLTQLQDILRFNLAEYLSFPDDATEAAVKLAMSHYRQAVEQQHNGSGAESLA